MADRLIIDLTTRQTRSVPLTPAEEQDLADRGAASVARADRADRAAAARAAVALTPAITDKLVNGGALTNPDRDAILRWLALRVAASELVP